MYTQDLYEPVAHLNSHVYSPTNFIFEMSKWLKLKGTVLAENDFFYYMFLCNYA